MNHVDRQIIDLDDELVRFVHNVLRDDDNRNLDISPNPCDRSPGLDTYMATLINVNYIDVNEMNSKLARWRRGAHVLSEKLPDVDGARYRIVVPLDVPQRRQHYREDNGRKRRRRPAMTRSGGMRWSDYALMASICGALTSGVYLWATY